MKKTIAKHNERSNKHSKKEADDGTAMPAYLLVCLNFANFRPFQQITL